MMLDSKDLELLHAVMQESVGKAESRMMGRMEEIGAHVGRIDFAVAEFEGRLARRMLETETRLTRRVAENEAHTTIKIKESETRMMERIDASIAESEARMMERIDTSIAESEARVTARIDKLEERMDKFEERMDKLEERMDKFEERMDKLEERMDKLEERMDKLEDRVEETRSTIMGYLEASIEPNIRALAEGHMNLFDGKASNDDMDKLKEELATTKSLVMVLGEDVSKLKKAQ